MEIVIPEGIRLLALRFKGVANAFDFISEQTQVRMTLPPSAQGTGRSSTEAFWEAHKISRLWGWNRICELGGSLGTGGGSRSNLNNAEMGTKCRGNS